MEKSFSADGLRVRLLAWLCLSEETENHLNENVIGHKPSLERSKWCDTVGFNVVNHAATPARVRAAHHSRDWRGKNQSRPAMIKRSIIGLLFRVDKAITFLDSLLNYHVFNK